MVLFNFDHSSYSYVQEIIFVFLNQSGVSEAKVLVFTYYDMVQDFNLGDISDKDEVPGQLFVALAGCDVTRGVVMDKNQANIIMLNGCLYNLAGVNRREAQ